MSLIFPIAFYVVFKLAPEHVRTGNGAFSSMRVSLGIRGAPFRGAVVLHALYLLSRRGGCYIYLI